MNDKQQIEEMAKIIEDRLYEGTSDSMSEGEGVWIAKELIKHYQPKLPEDAVVLTEKEYSKLKTYETLQKVRDDMGLDYSHGREEGYARARKETAQKFYDLSEKHGGGVVFYQQARKLAKQCGVEVKDN